MELKMENNDMLKLEESQVAGLSVYSVTPAESAVATNGPTKSLQDVKKKVSSLQQEEFEDCKIEENVGDELETLNDSVITKSAVEIKSNVSVQTLSLNAF